MEKKKASELEDQEVGAGYVYWSSMYEDLLEMVVEYLGEVEHAGIKPSAGEVSSSVVEDVGEFVDTRKRMLRKDFLEYWNENV